MYGSEKRIAAEKNARRTAVLRFLNCTWERPRWGFSEHLAGGRGAKKGEWTLATVVAVCTGIVRRDPKVPREEGMLRPGWGFLEDVHAGAGSRPVSLLRREDVARREVEVGFPLPPGSLAENLVIEGLPEELPVRTRLKFPSGAVLSVAERGKRPEEPHTYSYRGECLLPTVGYFLDVLEGGSVRPGDEVGWIFPG